MPQIQVWINNDDPANVEKLVKTLNDAMASHKDQKLKAFMIFLSDDKKAMESKLTAIADKTKSQDICLAYISPKDEAIEAYKVNVDPSVKNTVMVYKRKRITTKEVNLVADEKGMKTLQAAIDDVLK